MTSVTSEIYELLCCKQFVTVAILLIYHVIRFTDFVLNAVPIRVDENHELKNNQKNHFFTPDFFIVMNFLMDCVRDGHLSFVCCILTLLLLGGFPAMISTVMAWFWWEIQMLSACAEGRYCSVFPALGWNGKPGKRFAAFTLINCQHIK